MELRVLNYFLMVVREENITKATQHLKKRNWSFSIMRTSLPERFPLVVGKRGGGDLTILLLGLAFHCFCLENKKSLCHSLGRSSRSDFVQYEFVRMPFKERWGILVRNDSSLAKKKCCYLGRFAGCSFDYGAPGACKKRTGELVRRQL